MALRIGTGPVFAYEWIAATRRWQLYATRSLIVVMIFIGLAIVWSNSDITQASGLQTFDQQAELGQHFYMVMISVLLGLIALSAPSATAGSICNDKARGNLELLFATDLSSSEIVLGKLASRLIPVLGVIVCAMPVLALATLFGGIDPVTLAGSILVVAATAVLACTLALTLSVWGRRTHEVLLLTYMLIVLWLLGPMVWSVIPMGIDQFLQDLGFDGLDWLSRTNPVLLVIAPVDTNLRGYDGLVSHLGFATGALITAMLLAVLAVVRVRRVATRQASTGVRARRPNWLDALRAGLDSVVAWLFDRLRRLGIRLPGPSLDKNPVLWRECHRRQPSRWTMLAWGIYLVVVLGFLITGIVETIGGSAWGSGTGAVVNGVQALVGLGLLTITAATGLSEERQRGSLDVLLATPLPTRAIVLAKWWATFRVVLRLAVLTALIAVFSAIESNYYGAILLIGLLVLSYGAVISSLGLLIATVTEKLGRAVALSAGIYLTIAIGILPLVLFFDWRPGLGSFLILSASPFWGVGAYTAFIGNPFSIDFERMFSSVNILMCINFALAFLLLAFVLRIFNGRLGRVDARTAPIDPVRVVRDRSTVITNA